MLGPARRMPEHVRAVMAWATEPGAPKK
jgi:hypothetical protein